MTLDDINAWLTLVANIGVLVGIVFLIVELRQSTRATRLQTASEYESAEREFLLFVAGNPDFAEIIDKSVKGEQLTDLERFRQSTFFRASLRNWQTALVQYELGALSEPVWKAQLRFMEDLMRNDPAIGDFWRANQRVFTDDLNRLIASILDSA